MRLFGTAVLGVALAASQCAAQSAAEQAPIQISRAETQHESLRARNLSKKNKRKKHRNEETHTDIPTPTPIPAEEDEEYVKETRQNQPSCSICGDGMEVGNPDAGVSFPGQPGQIPCGVLENMGVIGLIPPAQCDVLPQLVSTVCECQSTINPTTTGATPPITTTDATKPGKGKASKSAQLSHSMSVPSKAAKSIQGKATSSPEKSGKSNKSTSMSVTTGSKGQKMMPSKASSKAEKSASKGSKTAATTVDAKAQKVTTTDSSKAAKASTATATETASTAASTPVSTSAAAAPVVASESAYLVPKGDSVRVTCPAGGQCCVGGDFFLYTPEGDATFETGGICGDDLLVTSGVLNICSSNDDCVVTCTGCDVEIQN